MLKPKSFDGGSWLALASGEDAPPWTRLSNAVILSAVDDYRKAMQTVIEKVQWLDTEEAMLAPPKKRERAERSITEARKTVREIEAFFRSEHCKLFTELDMVVIGKRIRAEFPEYEKYKGVKE